MQDQINEIDISIQRLHDRHAERWAALDRLEAQFVAPRPMTLAILAYADGGPMPDIVALATEDLALRRAAEAIATARRSVDETLDRDLVPLNRQRQDLAQQLRTLRNEANAFRARISGPQTPRWCVDDYLRGAAVLGNAELQDAVAWVRKHGVGHYADEWMEQRKQAA